MKFVFIVQGEGRGHLTQSMSLYRILSENGHEIIHTFRGRSFSGRKNGFRTDKQSLFFSPFFILSKNSKGLNLAFTFLLNLLLIPVYIFETIRIAIRIRFLKPDAVVNFYDIIGGLSSFLIPKRIKKNVISHHFFLSHPAFRWPVDRKLEKFLLVLHSGLVSFCADKILALSFTCEENIPARRLFVVPPLIRKEILQSVPSNNGHIHIYTLNPGYLSDVEKWCIMNPAKYVTMFSAFDSPDHGSKCTNLTQYGICGAEFINSLATCSRVISTSGFELLAEAASLGKPVEVFPSENHYEQYCNSMDFERSGLGIRKEHFSPGEEFVVPEERYNAYRVWLKDSERITLSVLCS